MRHTLLALLIASTALTACAHQRGGRRHADGKEAAVPKTAPLPDGLVGDGQQHGYAEPSPR